MTLKVWNKRLLLAQANGGHTKAEWDAMKRLYGFCCLRCKQKANRWKYETRLTKDHVIPLSKGGDDSIRNIQPLCSKCNGRKGDKAIDYRLRWPQTPPEYLPQPFNPALTGA